MERALSEHAQGVNEHIFTRISDCFINGNMKMTVAKMFAKDLYAHKNCSREYSRIPEDKPFDDDYVPPAPIKVLLFQRCVPCVDRIISSGDFCTMSELVEFALSLMKDGEELV